MKVKRVPWLLLFPFFFHSCLQGLQGEKGERGDDGEDAPRTGSIHGKVYDASSGEGIEGAFITGAPYPWETLSGSEGDFRKDDLFPGLYTITVNREGYTEEVLPDVSVLAGYETYLEVSLTRADGAADIEGIVLSPSGKGLEGVEIGLTPGDLLATTDEVGAFTFQNLEEGSYRLEATPPSSSHYFPYILEEVQIVENGSVELSITLSGRALQDAYYVGSSLCSTCHPLESYRHSLSPHYKSLALPSGEEDYYPFFAGEYGGELEIFPGVSIHLLFRLSEDGSPEMVITDSPGLSRTFTVTAVYGGMSHGWAFLAEIGSSSYPLPAGISLDEDGDPGIPFYDLEPFPLFPEFWFDEGGAFLEDEVTGTVTREGAFERRCAGCHYTGFSLNQNEEGEYYTTSRGTGEGYTEWNIGCEACHGAGSSHLEADFDEKGDYIVNPSLLIRERKEELCGSCHSLGTGMESPLFTSPPEYPCGPDGEPYTPGETLSDYFETTREEWEGTGFPLSFHQEYTDLLIGPHYNNDTYILSCTDCHDPHGPSTDSTGFTPPFSLRMDPYDNSLCLSCHTSLNFSTQEEVEAHTGHMTYDPEGTGAGSCIGCHMIYTVGFSGWNPVSYEGRIRDHSFRIIEPELSLSFFDLHGEDHLDPGEVIPNSCSGCHFRNEYLRSLEGGSCPCPAGEPGERATYELLQDAYEEFYP